MIQKIILRLFRIGFRTTEILFPPLAKRWAMRLFFTPRRFRRPTREQALLKAARRQRVLLTNLPYYHNASAEYVLYEWGRGPEILLVHGWEGRGSQMTAFVNPLVNAGYHVLAFDGFAHGDSTGKRTNALEFFQIIKDIERRYGNFEAIIGHSLGGMVAAFALASGVRAEKLITISSPATLAFIFEAFAAQINASRRINDHLMEFLERVTGRPAEGFSTIHNVSRLNRPGLIIHDKDDKEIPYQQAQLLKAHWPESRLVQTEGLGHRRILRDPRTIEAVLNFLGVYRGRDMVNDSLRLNV